VDEDWLKPSLVSADGRSAVTAENGIIQQYAAHLERKASGLLMRWTLGLGFVGGLLGAFPFLHISHGVVSGDLGLGTMLLGAIAGAYLGYSTGQKKAVEPRMQAQLALHQLQVEQSLIGRVAAAPVPVPAPVVAAPPVTPPAAVAPAPVAPAPAPPASAPAFVQAPAPAPLAPAPAPVAPAPAAPAAPAPAPVPITLAPAAPAAVVPRLVEPPQTPPLSRPVGV
jgi:hypothetical protein